MKIEVGKVYTNNRGESYKIMLKKRHFKETIFIGHKVLPDNTCHSYPEEFNFKGELVSLKPYRVYGKLKENYNERDLILEEKENKTC